MSEAQSQTTPTPNDHGDPKPKPPGSATRDHLANERTLLAWSRTGIAIIALGFVVARFGLLIRELGARIGHVPASATGLSTGFGAALVICGGLATLLALARYLRTGRQIERGEYHWSPWLGVSLASVLLIASVLVTVYLFITA